MAWKGDPEQFTFGLRHKDVCPLLKQWRNIKKGRAEKTPELRQEMLQLLCKSLHVKRIEVDGGIEATWSEEFYQYVRGNSE